MGFLIPGSLVRVQPGVLKSTGKPVLFSCQARGSFVAPASILKSVPGEGVVNDREVDHRLKGSEFLLEMLGRSRLRAPAFAEFLKGVVDQASSIQILHHFRPHDVVLG
jgi:hypothetical protein